MTREPKDYLLVPVELCEVIIKNKWSKAAAVWLGLKAISDGQLKLNNRITKVLKKLVGYKSKKSIYNQIDKLIELNWVGKDLNGWYYIGGFKRVIDQEGICSRTAAEFIPKQDLDYCEEFFFSASVGHKVKRRLAARNYKIGSSKSGSIKTELPGRPYRPENLSISYLSKFFGLSEGKIARLKKSAKKGGYLDIEEYYSKDPAFTDPRYSKFYHSTLSGRVFGPNNSRFIRLTDGLSANIRFKSRRFA